MAIRELMRAQGAHIRAYTGSIGFHEKSSLQSHKDLKAFDGPGVRA
jgi:hypothetical protein